PHRVTLKSSRSSVRWIISTSMPPPPAHTSSATRWRAARPPPKRRAHSSPSLPARQRMVVTTRSRVAASPNRSRHASTKGIRPRPSILRRCKWVIGASCWRLISLVMMFDSHLQQPEPRFLHASLMPTNHFPFVLDAENLFREHGSAGFSTVGHLMSYRLPPLNGLRAFEAAARHLSFKHAANQLGGTPGAGIPPGRAL